MDVGYKEEYMLGKAHDFWNSAVDRRSCHLLRSPTQEGNSRGRVMGGFGLRGLWIMQMMDFQVQRKELGLKMRIWGHEYILSKSSIYYLRWEELAKPADN